MKTVDLLVKEGFNSMEALALLDGDDLAQTKVPHGQQNLLLSVVRPLQRLNEMAQLNMPVDTAATADRQVPRSGGLTNGGGAGMQAIKVGVLTTGHPDDRTRDQSGWLDDQRGWADNRSN